MQFCQNTCFLKVIVESNFVEPVDFLNIDRICSLEVAWIQDIKLISDSFDFLFIYFILPHLYDVIMLL